MRRWLLPLGQLAIGLLILPQAAIVGTLGTYPFFMDFFAGRLREDLGLYGSGLLMAGLAVDAALLLCLVAAAMLFRRPSRLGARFSIAAAICYSGFAVADSVAGVALSYPRTSLSDLVPLYVVLIALAAALLAFAVWRYVDGMSESHYHRDEEYGIQR